MLRILSEPVPADPNTKMVKEDLACHHCFNIWAVIILKCECPFSSPRLPVNVLIPENSDSEKTDQKSAVSINILVVSVRYFKKCCSFK